MGLGGSKRQRTEGDDGDGFPREEYHRGDDNVWRGGGKAGTSNNTSAAGGSRAQVDVRDLGNSLYSCTEGAGDGGGEGRGGFQEEPGSVAGYGLVTDEDGDFADEFIQCDAPPQPRGGAAQVRRRLARMPQDEAGKIGRAVEAEFGGDLVCGA